MKTEQIFFRRSKPEFLDVVSQCNPTPAVSPHWNAFMLLSLAFAVTAGTKKQAAVHIQTGALPQTMLSFIFGMDAFELFEK